MAVRCRSWTVWDRPVEVSRGADWQAWQGQDGHDESRIGEARQDVARQAGLVKVGRGAERLVSSRQARRDSA